MGSPLSPILADIVMNTLLSNVERQLPFEIPVLRKFVDDLFIALPADQIDTTLNIFNAYNPHIQFTKEEEVEGKLPFLDMVITRNPDQTLSTEWYAKPISSGRLLNYWSSHPMSMKINVAVNLIHRVNRLTNNRTLKQQKQTVFDVLRLNDYPPRLINQLMNKIKTPPTIQETNRTSQNTATSPPIIQPTNTATEEPQMETTLYRSLPFIPVLTPNIRKILKKEFPNVKIAAKTINTTAKILPNIKDPVEPLQQSNVIYQIPCSGCSMTYIGMTRNCLQKRMYGHQTDINKYNSLVENGVDTPQQMDIVGGHTALIEHIILQKHMFDLRKVKIIDRSYRLASLPILEMCHIANTTDTVNRRTDVDGLSNVYAGILHTVKSQKTHNNNNNTSNYDNSDNTYTNTEQLVELE